MELFDYIVWALLFVLAEAVLFFIQVPVRKRDNRPLNIVVFIVKLLLIVVLAYGVVATTSSFWWNLAPFFGALYCALLGDVVASIVWFVIRLARARASGGRAEPASPKPGRRTRALAFTSLVAGAVILVLGTVNMQVVTCEESAFSSEKLSQTHTFAFVSDIHMGTAQQSSSLEGVVSQINAAHPDFVVLGGDVTDEMSKPEELEGAYEILSEIEAPTYFVYGNHDRQSDGDLLGGRTYTDDELVAAIEGNGIVVLSDSYWQISDDLVLLGREDLSGSGKRKPAAVVAAENPAPDAFLLVVDHEPYDSEEEAAALGFDLQVSGHTHAGQLFPLQFIYNAIGLPAYGEYTLGGNRLWVSAGESGWAAPLRTEARCTWDLITLAPR